MACPTHYLPREKRNLLFFPLDFIKFFCYLDYSLADINYLLTFVKSIANRVFLIGGIDDSDALFNVSGI